MLIADPPRPRGGHHRSDWAPGYAEGKRARAAGIPVHDGSGHTKAWVDGFKTGWYVAGDD